MNQTGPQWPEDPRVLVYTVCRATGAPQVTRAFGSLREGAARTGAPHDWLLWCNSPDTWKASELGWTGLRHTQDGGANVGQHIPLRWVLELARGEETPRYDFIVRVDDDLEWLTQDWLAALLHTARHIYEFSGKLAVISAHVLGLINEIQKVPLRIQGMPVYAAGIAGGACRLHHLSFFEGYEPDCRLAMGSSDATTIARHAEGTHIPIFITPKVRVRHDTRAHVARDPLYAEEHGVLQRIPYIPPWRGEGADDVPR